MGNVEDFESRLESLSDKQREVLDLLIQHKTSKEIARDLGLSPHTVDQRMQYAKRNLGVSSRNELAAEYRLLVETCGRMTHQFFDVEKPIMFDNEHLTADAESSYFFSSDTNPDRIQNSGQVDHRVGPEMFEVKNGTFLRLGAMTLSAMVLILVVLGGLAIFAQLSALLAQ